MEISIFGLEAVLEASELIEKMVANKTPTTAPNLARVRHCLEQARLSEYPYNSKLNALELEYKELSEKYSLTV